VLRLGYWRERETGPENAPCYNAAAAVHEQEVSTLADQLRLFTDLNTPLSYVVIYDFHPETNIFVVLAQTPVPVPASKRRPALFRHKPGRIPQLEAKAIARYLGDKEHGSRPAIMA
jgi:hypothetical protein